MAATNVHREKHRRGRGGPLPPAPSPRSTGEGEHFISIQSLQRTTKCCTSPVLFTGGGRKIANSSTVGDFSGGGPGAPPAARLESPVFPL